MKEKIKSLYTKYESRLSAAALIAGFIWDNLTLTRIDLWFDNLVILIYLLVAGLGIVILNLRSGVTGRLTTFLSFAMQFAFGGLFSAFIIFYSKSASFITSWPFLLVLAVLLIGNEFFRERYLRLTFQVSIFFLALYSYSIFALPVLLGKMGAWIFLLSGVISITLISLFILLLFYATRKRARKSKRSLIISISTIFIAFNIFYFTNIIPPVPLSLKSSGVYHYIERNIIGGYIARSEPLPWYLFYKKLKPDFHWTANSPIYIYSAVFAPTDLDTSIFHRWSYFDENKNNWIITDRLSFQIIGGRGGGYRGYTFKSNIKNGDWRVDVITERDQLLGRIKFKVIKTTSQPELKIIKLN